NGDAFCFSDLGRSYGPSYTTGDTVGCCLNFPHKIISFIKNGVHIGGYISCIGLKSRGDSVEAIFGNKKFKYEVMNDSDIDDESLKESWNKIMFKYDSELRIDG
ncbi:9836_t:CDS:2, partial [Acaulospora morrowiae]